MATKIITPTVITNTNSNLIDFTTFLEVTPYLPIVNTDQLRVEIADPTNSTAGFAGAGQVVTATQGTWNIASVGTFTSAASYKLSSLTYTNAADANQIVTYAGNMTEAGGTYSSIRVQIPNNFGPYTASVDALFEGNLGRNSGGGVLGGTLTHILVTASGKTVELKGLFNVNINGDIDFTNNGGGYVSYFRFSDGTHSLTVDNLLHNATSTLTFAELDALTFKQHVGGGIIEVNYDNSVPLIQTTLVSLFNAPELTAGETVEVVDPTSGETTHTIPDGFENGTIPDAQNIPWIGNALNNKITGNASDNTIEGRAGNDTLTGLAGNDTLKGEDGLDILLGGDGNDTLDGGAGKDTLTGGAGNDSYVIDVNAKGQNVDKDKIVEAKNGGSDTLVYRNTGLTAQTKAVTLKLLANFENLDISQTGTMNFNLTGDKNANTLTGNAGNNLIDGGAGADTMAGGAGNDTYVVDNAGDSVTDTSGTDQVNVKIATANGSYTLGSDIENGKLVNTKAFTLIGNTLDNTLTGNGAANTINGDAGNDTIDGGKGNDTLNGDAGNDSLIGGVGNDTLSGGADNDILNGGAGKDILTGGAGNDTLTGGAAADTFVFNIADIGAAGTPSIDTIVDFKMKDKDVIDLRGLLTNPNASEADPAVLSTFIDIATDGTNTQIHISSAGSFTGGAYSAGAEDAMITLSNVNLLAGTDEATLLQKLITQNQLLID